MEYSKDNPWMDPQMLYFEEVAEEGYREREPQKNDPYGARAHGTRDAVMCAFRQQVYLAS